MATKKPVRSSGGKKTAKTTPKTTKMAKPAKAVKKSAPAKKAAPKKTAKTVKPVTKTVKKAKAAVSPAKKIARPANKVVPKKAVKPASKKLVPNKKASTPAKKKVAVVVSKTKTAVKPIPKKPIVKAVKKAIPVKTVTKPVVKAAAKPVLKTTTPVKTAAVQTKQVTQQRPLAYFKPIVAPIPQRPAPKKPEPVKEVKVPKTSVKTSVPYQPDYKPLEQRFATMKNNETLVKYSDAELAEFRELIHKKLDSAKKELTYLQGLITRKDEMGGDETDNRYMTMEDGSMSMEREQLSQMASRQITYIDHLEKALIRIGNQTYGICRVTGNLIDKARLKAVPHATLSLEAKLGLVKPSNEQ